MQFRNRSCSNTRAAADDPQRTGICCSGGGLRSAAFSFGALDVLWREGIVQDAELPRRRQRRIVAVTAATIVRAHSDDASWSQDKPGPYGLGSPELDYLRNRTDYLAPGIDGPMEHVPALLMGILFNLAVILGVLFVVGRPADASTGGRCTTSSCT